MDGDDPPPGIPGAKGRGATAVRVVKIAFANRVRSDAVRAVIDSHVAHISQLTHRATLLLNVLLLIACQRGRPIVVADAGAGAADANAAVLDAAGARHYLKLFSPDRTGANAFFYLFTIGSHGVRVESVIQEAYDECLAGDDLPWSHIGRLTGDTNPIVYAARTMHTNFVNACVVPFDGRQNAHVKRWTAAHGLGGKKAAWSIQCAINGWSCRTPLPAEPGVAAFVQAERAALGIEPGVACTAVWRKKHLLDVVRYYHHILSAIPADDGRARRFTLAPVADIKRHFLTMDTRWLRVITGDHTSTKRDLWAKCFDLSGLRGGDWEGGTTVQSDGVSLCVRLKQRGAAPPPRPPADAKEVRTGKKRKVRPSAPAAMDENTVVAAMDPGRADLIHCVARGDNNELRVFKLTRRAYYNGTGKPRADARRAQWNTEVADAHAELGTVSPKTASLENFNAYVAVVAKHYNRLWKHRLHRRWAREDLRFYILKHRVMDRWLMGLKRALEGPGPVKKTVKIAYGAATFSPTGHGEPEPAPTSFQYRRVGLAFGAENVTLVNEDYTTKCCAVCGAAGRTTVLQTVYERRQAQDGTWHWRAIRGLKRCGSTECLSFVVRDANGAYNILLAYEAAARDEERPHHLQRGNPGVQADPGRFQLRAHA